MIPSPCQESAIWSMRLSSLLSTVEPGYNGPVLNQFSKSRSFAHTNAVIATCIKRPPLLSGCGHPLAVPCWSFFVLFTCIKRSPLSFYAVFHCVWLCLRSDPSSLGNYKANANNSQFIMVNPSQMPPMSCSTKSRDAKNITIVRFESAFV